MRSLPGDEYVKGHAACQFIAIAHAENREAFTRYAAKDFQVLRQAKDTSIGRF